MTKSNETAPGGMNESAPGTATDTGLTQPGSLFDLDMTFETTRRDLIAKRTAAGADTPPGHRCSNLIEQLDAYRAAEGEQKANLAKSIQRTLAELNDLHQ